MEPLSWINLIASGLLFVACVLLLIDGRGQRRALGAAETTITVLQRQLTTHETQLATLGRAVATIALDGGLARNPVPEEPASDEEAPPTPPRTAPDDARAARCISTRPPPAVAVLERTAARDGEGPSGPRRRG